MTDKDTKPETAEPDEYEYDMLWHALNYRGADSSNAEARWQDLLSCHERIVARAVAAEHELIDSLRLAVRRVADGADESIHDELTMCLLNHSSGVNRTDKQKFVALMREFGLDPKEASAPGMDGAPIYMVDTHSSSAFFDENGKFIEFVSGDASFDEREWDY